MASIFDEDCLIPPLRRDLIFPNPRYASTEGLLAYGGDLSPDRLLTAYRKGIFPWFNSDDPILWWSPDPRLLLYPDQFKMQKSFRRVLRNGGFVVKFDHTFEEVIRLCGAVPRNGQKGTWLTKEMQEAYIILHEMGFAHSVEVYLQEELVGGLYGIAMGKAFFGESMFSLKDNASKIAFKALSDVLGLRGYDFIDCQVSNEHLLRLGATLVPRGSFLNALDESLTKSSDLGSWQYFEWRYSDET
ncbi:MAG: leucyl/phenylalanyl-tRNA--protein transferase [Epsilonproteobacteria bacterium]|nr:MAG: leucyl/phenylalanyl-tRNA--protein transferase [Campylobacterota bacterium]